MPTEKGRENKRPLSFRDIVKGNEFTIGQHTTVESPSGSIINLGVGDVIKIEGFNAFNRTFWFSVNGHLRGRDAPCLPYSDVGDIIIDNSAE